MGELIFSQKKTRKGKWGFEKCVCSFLIVFLRSLWGMRWENEKKKGLFLSLLVDTDKRRQPGCSCVECECVYMSLVDNKG